MKVIGVDTSIVLIQKQAVGVGKDILRCNRRYAKQMTFISFLCQLVVRRNELRASVNILDVRIVYENSNNANTDNSKYNSHTSISQRDI